VASFSSLRRLADPHSMEFGVASSIVVGALSLVDPAPLRPGARVLYRTTIAGFTAAMTWVAARGEFTSVEARVGTTVGATGAAFGLLGASEAIDARMQRGLVRMGVRRPRLVIAATSVAISAATFLADRAVSEHLAADADGHPFDWEDRPLPDTVRVLTAALLARTDAFGAPELRAQLATARERTFTDERYRSSSFVQFAVADDAPLAVPGNAAFPVTARFASDGGTLYVVTLGIAEGRLASLEIVEVTDDGDEPSGEAERWPEAHEVTLHVETSRGTVPLG
jgi:hypothetical protein